MNNHEKELEEAVIYFKSRKVYDKLFKGFKNKYSSLGRFGGNVVIKKLTNEERRDLGGFLAKDYTGKSSIRISFGMMEKALSKSCFSNLSWKEIFERYFDEPLVTKEDEETLKRQERKKFFNDTVEKYSKEKLNDNSDKFSEKRKSIYISPKIWLNEIIENKSDGANLIIRNYNNFKINEKEALNFQDILVNTMLSIDRLPIFYNSDKKLLPVYASESTGNPHYFDNNMLAEKILINYLEYIFKVKYNPSDNVNENEISGEMTYAEYKSELFLKAGIILDNLSNDVLTYNLIGVFDDGNFHVGMEGFRKIKEPIKLTYLTLCNIDKLVAEKKRVYVVENPSVFMMLFYNYPEESIICSNGQLRRAVLKAIDKIEGSIKIYYSGDFDPEGMLIAQKLKKRYGEKLILWNYTSKQYLKNMSDEDINDSRLKILERIDLEELLDIKEKMLLNKKATYQEAFVDEIKPCGY